MRTNVWYDPYRWLVLTVPTNGTMTRHTDLRYGQRALQCRQQLCHRPKTTNALMPCANQERIGVMTEKYPYNVNLPLFIPLLPCFFITLPLKGNHPTIRSAFSCHDLYFFPCGSKAKRWQARPRQQQEKLWQGLVWHRSDAVLTANGFPEPSKTRYD